MATLIPENLQTIEPMDLEFTSIPMADNTKASGKMIAKMGMELKNGLTILFSKANTKMEKSMDMGLTFGATVPGMKENGKKIA